MPYSNDRSRQPRDSRNRSDYSRESRRDDRAIDSARRRDSGRGHDSGRSFDASRMYDSARDDYEIVKARREARARESAGRNRNRDLIDARGSIDSRAFNENQEIVGYTINKEDAHDPLIETNSSSRWNSRDAQDARSAPRRRNLDNLGSTVTGRTQYGQKKEGLPGVIKFLILLIIVLLIILLVILFM